MTKSEIIKTYLLLLEDYPRRKEIGELPEHLQKYADENGELRKEFRKQIRVIATGGKFDVIHPGHLFLLEKAREQGDLLVVIAASNGLVEKVNGKKPRFTQEERVRILSSLKPVDLAIAGTGNRDETLRRISPDLIVLGYDQHEWFKAGNRVEVRKIERLGDYSSSGK